MSLRSRRTSTRAGSARSGRLDDLLAADASSAREVALVGLSGRRADGFASVRYEIRIAGALSDTLLCAFPDFHADVCGGETLLVGLLPDQAALHGVLAQVEALGLELIEVRRGGA